MNMINTMCIVSAFVTSCGLVAMGIIEQFDTPLTIGEKLCFNYQYSDCSYELRALPKPPFILYIVGGISIIAIMYVILNYNKAFNKMEMYS